MQGYVPPALTPPANTGSDNDGIAFCYGGLPEFFKAIYFFVECLVVIGAAPACYPAPGT